MIMCKLRGDNALDFRNNNSVFVTISNMIKNLPRMTISFLIIT